MGSHLPSAAQCGPELLLYCCLQLAATLVSWELVRERVAVLQLPSGPTPSSGPWAAPPEHPAAQSMASVSPRSLGTRALSGTATESATAGLYPLPEDAIHA